MGEARPKFDGQLMFPTEFLAAEDLQGHDVTVEIEAVRSESLRTTDGAEQKYTIRFKGKRKRLVLNKTNAKLIATATGVDEARNWAGHHITLYPTTCRAFGQTTPCIRVRERTSQTAAAPPPSPDQGVPRDEQPFENNGVDTRAFEEWRESKGPPPSELFDKHPTNTEPS